MIVREEGQPYTLPTNSQPAQWGKWKKEEKSPFSPSGMASPHPLPPSVDPFLFFKGKGGVGKKIVALTHYNRRREILPNQWEENASVHLQRFWAQPNHCCFGGCRISAANHTGKTLAFPPQEWKENLLSSSSVRSGEQVCLMSCDNRISKRPPSTPQPWQEDQPVRPNVAVAPNNTCIEKSTPPLI